MKHKNENEKLFHKDYAPAIHEPEYRGNVNLRHALDNGRFPLVRGKHHAAQLIFRDRHTPPFRLLFRPVNKSLFLEYA